MDFEKGVIVKIYKSQVDPILVGGRLRRPQTKMGISSGPGQSPHFQNCEFERENFFSPERRSKVVKFSKNDRLDELIILARGDRFLFFPLKMIQRVDQWMFFSSFSCHMMSHDTLQFCYFFCLFITYSFLTSIIQPDMIDIFVYTDTL